jgi:predicted FMN-binding regulatory protein PaiB
VPFNTTEFEGEEMEQVPTWLAAAVSAAGLTTAYNAEDWDRNADAEDQSAEPQARDFPPLSF